MKARVSFRGAASSSAQGHALENPKVLRTFSFGAPSPPMLAKQATPLPEGRARRRRGEGKAASFFVSLLFVLGFLFSSSAHANAPVVLEGLSEGSRTSLFYEAGISSLVGGWETLEGLEGVVEVREHFTIVDGRAVRVWHLDATEVLWEQEALGALEGILVREEGEEGLWSSLSLRGDWGELSWEAQLPLELEDLEALSMTEISKRARGEGRLTLEVVDFADLPLPIGPKGLAGPASLHLDFEGPMGAPALRMTASGEEMRLYDTPLAPFALRWDQTKGETRIEGRVDDQRLHLSGTLPAHLDLTSMEVVLDVDQALSLELHADRLDQEHLRPFWSAPRGVTVQLNGSLSAEGSLKDLRLSGRFEGNHQQEGEVAQPLSLEFDGSDERLKLLLSMGFEALEAEMIARFSWAEVIERPEEILNIPLEGKLESAIPLSALAVYAPPGIVDPIGVLFGEATLGGTLGAPALEGALRLDEGSFILTALTRRLEEISFSATISGQTLEIESLFARSYQGLLDGRGRFLMKLPNEEEQLWAGWSLSGQLWLQAMDFPFVQEGFPLGVLDSALEVELVAAKDALDLGLHLEGGSISLGEEELPSAGAIQANPSVQILSSASDAGRSLGLDEIPSLDLRVSIDPPLEIRGPGIKTDIQGLLEVHRKEDLVQIEGALRPTPGDEISLFGNDFKISEGRISVAEGWLSAAPLTQEAMANLSLKDPDEAPSAQALEPEVELVARGLLVDTYVLVKIEGPLRRPKLVLASLPPLPEYQIITLMITGRVDAIDERNGEVRRAVAKLLERYHNPGLKRQLFDKIGVDKLGLKFGANVTHPILTIGKQLSRPLYVETIYHHDAPEDANLVEGRVQYRLDTQWTLDSAFGDAAEGSFGLFWGTSFGGEPLPPPPDDSWGVTPRIYRDSDGDKRGDSLDRCPELAEDFDDFQDRDGCPDLDNDADGIPDAIDLAPNLPERLNGFEDGDGAPDVAPLRLQGLRSHAPWVRFDSGETQLQAEDDRALEVVLLAMKAHPELVVEIQGHADLLGDPEENLTLSQARAEEAQARLEALGADPARLKIAVMGTDQALPLPLEPEPQRINRRISFGFEVEASDGQ